MSEPEYFRTFVAVTPDERVLDLVQNTINGLRRELDVPGIRWEHRSKWHVTLRFLGDVPVTSVPELCAAIEAACNPHTAFPAKVIGLGAFPSLKRPRILWVGLEDPEGRLARLQQNAAQASSRFSVKDDEKRFRPHLTVARIKTEDRRVLSKIEPAVQPILRADFGTWEVNCVELWRSTLQAGGSKYELLKQFWLQK